MHYVCTGGCGGVSPEPKNCGSETCSKHNHPLTPCSCTDGEHKGLLSACENCGKICKADGGTCEMEAFKEELQ